MAGSDVDCAPQTVPTESIILITFSDLGLNGSLLKALAAANHCTPTPIQSRAIPELLAGRDLLGIAQTGTGKTAAFALPIMHELLARNIPAQSRSCHVLILSPTRELCAQIGDAIRSYARFARINVAAVYGGVAIGPQITSLQSGSDIVVATPGRLVDIIERRALSLDRVGMFVLDEADRMLDLGFIHSIRKITRFLPKKRQSMFFSATMPSPIATLARELLNSPARVEVSPAASTVDKVKQGVIHLKAQDKLAVLVDLLKDSKMTRGIVFTRTKRGADKLTRGLGAAAVDASAIHGNKSQSQRERALAKFRGGKTRVLVATDIAARGIDVDGITHVVNYDLPEIPESYVHRIGRTARAGAAGVAISFCDPLQKPLLCAIERLIKKEIERVDHPLASKFAANRPTNRAARGRLY
jgi:ATP-dependent RNA helicase RhlE